MAVNEELFEGQKQSIRTDQALSNTSLPRLTSQEQMFVAALNAGASISEASRRCGISTIAGGRLRQREDIDQAIRHYNAEFARDVLPHVQFNRDDAHHMYMTAYRNSANATEQIKATDSLVKLHGLHTPEKTPEEKEVNSAKQLENMSAQELLKMAGYKLASLTPDEIADGEYTDVEA